MSQARRGGPARRFYALLGVIAVLGLGALGYAASQRGAAASAGAPRDAVDPALAAEAKGHVMGRADAPVKIEEFSDFECPYCAQFATVTGPDVKSRLVETGQASFVYYDFPLPMHANTWKASHAAMCAEEQGKFWEMHDRVFTGQNDWNAQATSNPKSVFAGYAREIGLNAAQWEQCYDSEKHLRKIQANKAEAERRGVNGTPTFFVNGRKFEGINYDGIKALVDSARAEVVARGGTAPAPTDSAATRSVPAASPR